MSANINGTDEEDFGSNEFGHAAFTKEIIINDATPQNLIFMECRWGGECRVELGINGERLEDDSIRVDGFAQLFEGTDEGTGDLDGTIEFVFVVNKGKTVVDTRRVVNQDEGGDFADISMTVSNNILEEE